MEGIAPGADWNPDRLVYWCWEQIDAFKPIAAAERKIHTSAELQAALQASAGRPTTLWLAEGLEELAKGRIAFT